MATTLVTNFRSGNVSVSSLSGITPTQVGGHLRRETAISPTTSNCHQSNRAVQYHREVYVIHASSITTGRIYKFDGDAFFSDISALSGLFTLGEVIVGQTSSATAVVADASITGDDFIIIKTISGTFQAGEIVVGSDSSATAILVDAPQQGGGIGYEGEWTLEHSFTNTIDGPTNGFIPHTGIYSIFTGGRHILSAFYLDTSQVVNVINYHHADGLWLETVSNRTLTGIDIFGKSFVLGEQVWSAISTASNVDFSYFTASNPASRGSGSIVTIGQNTNFNSDNNGLGFEISEYKGRYFTWIFGSSTNEGRLVELLDEGGATKVGVFSPGTDGSTERPNNGSAGGILMYVLNDIMYVFYSSVSGGWVCGRFHIDSSGEMVSSTINSTGYSSNERFSDFLMPAGLRSGLNFTLARFKAVLDQETNDPDGADSMIIYHVGDPAGGTTEGYTHSGISDLSLTYTWDGTTTVTASGDPVVTDSLSVGDWIGLGSDQRIFEISAFATPSGGPANSTITILDTFSIGIPSGATTTVKESAFSFVGSSGALAELAFSESREGIGQYSFVKTEPDISIVSVDNDSNGPVIKFICYSDSGTETVSAGFYYGPNLQAANSKCTLIDASSGTINSVNDVVDLTADNSTVYEVTWDLAADNIPLNSQRSLVPKITIT